MTGAHTFSIVWHNDNGGAKVHMRQSRCAHGQRGNSYLPRLSLLIRKDETLHNLGFKWIYEVLSNYIHCFEAVMLCRSRATGSSICSAVFGNPSIVAFQSREQQCETVLTC